MVERCVQIAHSLPGRVRLRVVALRRRREECATAARALAALAGVVEVRVDPFTGSFLVRYDGARVDAPGLASVLRDATGATVVLGPGERPPRRRRSGRRPPSRVGRAFFQVFRDVNEDLLDRTDGKLDLGVLASASLFALGAAEVVASGKVRPPPWFNLAWWGFQTFMYSDGGAIRASDTDPTTDASSPSGPTQPPT